MPFGLFATKSTYDAKAGAHKFKATVVSLAMTEFEEPRFDLNNDAHLSRISECTAALNEHLPILQSRDKHIAIGFGIAGAALALAAVIPFGLTIAISGVAYGAYFLGGRDDPYNKFNAALEELAHCCDWALSDFNSHKICHENVKAMLKTLAPFVTRDDLITIMGSESEANRVINALKILNSHEQDVHHAPETTQNLPKPTPYQLATRDTVNYHLYGYQQGGSLASLGHVILIYLQTAYSYVCNLISEAFNKTEEESNHDSAAAMKV